MVLNKRAGGQGSVRTRISLGKPPPPPTPGRLCSCVVFSPTLGCGRPWPVPLWGEALCLDQDGAASNPWRVCMSKCWVSFLHWAEMSLRWPVSASLVDTDSHGSRHMHSQ